MSHAILVATMLGPQLATTVLPSFPTRSLVSEGRARAGHPLPCPPSILVDRLGQSRGGHAQTALEEPLWLRPDASPVSRARAALAGPLAWESLHGLPPFRIRLGLGFLGAASSVLTCKRIPDHRPGHREPMSTMSAGSGISMHAATAPRHPHHHHHTTRLRASAPGASTRLSGVGGREGAQEGLPLLTVLLLCRLLLVALRH